MQLEVFSAHSVCLLEQHSAYWWNLNITISKQSTRNTLVTVGSTKAEAPAIHQKFMPWEGSPLRESIAHVLSEKPKAVLYQHILQHNLLGPVFEFYGDDYRLVQDNYPKHSTKSSCIMCLQVAKPQPKTSNYVKIFGTTWEARLMQETHKKHLEPAQFLVEDWDRLMDLNWLHTM